ncbi:hypothetical protein R1sor_000484 [Riccia sorocarpa]|uniref:BTB domain-containing protein n=1 Tax=Riccia sorocarpa TaxID=122646 RepID=A0ABD3GWB2_9MARC
MSGLDARFSNCSCFSYVRDRVSVSRSVALELCEQEKSIKELRGTVKELRDKLYFLVAYEPGPLNEGFRGDIILVGYDEEPVHAHRFILAGKSDVFRRMFENDMREKESGIVRIEDATAPVLRSMVKFCYTAEASFTEASVAEVLRIAHKYCIIDLKTVCESELSKDINADNICDRMVVAEMYEAKSLEYKLNVFFKENFDRLNMYSVVAKRLCSRSDK